MRQPCLAPFSRLWVDLDDQFAFLGPVERVAFCDTLMDVLEPSECVIAIVLCHGTHRDRTEAEMHPQSERLAGGGRGCGSGSVNR